MLSLNCSYTNRKKTNIRLLPWYLHRVIYKKNNLFLPILHSFDRIIMSLRSNINLLLTLDIIIVEFDFFNHSGFELNLFLSLS